MLLDARPEQIHLCHLSKNFALGVVGVLLLALVRFVVGCSGRVHLHVGRVGDLPDDEGSSAKAGKSGPKIELF